MIFAPCTFYYAIAGRLVEVTAAFATVAEANAYNAAHPDEGCLADLSDSNGLILMAKLADLGRPFSP